MIDQPHDIGRKLAFVIGVGVMRLVAFAMPAHVERDDLPPRARSACRTSPAPRQLIAPVRGEAVHQHDRRPLPYDLVGEAEGPADRSYGILTPRNVLQMAALQKTALTLSAIGFASRLERTRRRSKP